MKKILIIILVLIACKQPIKREPLHVEWDFNNTNYLEVEFINLSRNYDSLQWIFWNLDTFEIYADTFYYIFPEADYYTIELNGWQYNKPKKTYRDGIKVF